MGELREVKLNDPGQPWDELKVVVCRAEREGVTKFTCVRADNTLPTDGPFDRAWSTLLDVDLTESGDVWVFRSAPSLGEITSADRLKVLLGGSIVVRGWTITPTL